MSTYNFLLKIVEHLQYSVSKIMKIREITLSDSISAIPSASNCQSVIKALLRTT